MQKNFLINLNIFFLARKKTLAQFMPAYPPPLGEKSWTKLKFP